MSTGSGVSVMTGSKLHSMNTKPTLWPRLGFFTLAGVGLLILQVLTADMSVALTLVVYVVAITVVMLVIGILRAVISPRGEKAGRR